MDPRLEGRHCSAGKPSSACRLLPAAECASPQGAGAGGPPEHFIPRDAAYDGGPHAVILRVFVPFAVSSSSRVLKIVIVGFNFIGRFEAAGVGIPPCEA